MVMSLAVSVPSLERLAMLVEQNVRCRTSGLIHSLRVQIQDGQLVISGRTSCYYHKQLISQAALDAAEEVTIRNNVKVV